MAHSGQLGEPRGCMKSRLGQEWETNGSNRRTLVDKGNNKNAEHTSLYCIVQCSRLSAR